MKLCHMNDEGKWKWNPSLKFGFNCFNDFQEERLIDDIKVKKCENLYYRPYTNCKENNNHC